MNRLVPSPLSRAAWPQLALYSCYRLRLLCMCVCTAVCLVSVQALATGSEVAAAAPWPAEAPPSEGWKLLRAVGMFAVVIALLFATAWGLRKWQPGVVRGRQTMQVISVLPLGGRDRIVVVKAGERQLLLSHSPGRIALLGDYQRLLCDDTSAADFQKQLEEES